LFVLLTETLRHRAALLSKADLSHNGAINTKSYHVGNLYVIYKTLRTFLPGAPNFA